MKIHVHKLSIAGAPTMGTWYVVFAFFSKLWPTQIINLLTSVHMIKPLPILARYFNVTIPTFFLGLMFHLLLGYLFLGMMGTIYNFMQNKQ